MAKITVDDMRDKLLTVKQAKLRLGKTEPLSPVLFPMTGSKHETASFKLEGGWNEEIRSKADTAPLNAYCSIGGNEFQVTKEALLEATSLIGITKQYAMRTPGELLEPHINYWFQNSGEKELKALIHKDQILAFTKSGIEPFSNVRLVDEIIEGIKSQYGKNTEVLVDYKFSHSLRRTNVRLLVPSTEKEVRKDDPWCVGISLRNSIIGEQGVGTEVKGYLFRWWCTNGATSTHASAGVWNRKRKGQDDSVYEWARDSVDEILGGLEHEFEALEELAVMEVEDMSTALEDVFDLYRVPQNSREAIIERMVASDDMTMYGVMQAITQAANDDVSESIREQLMDIGGDLPRHSTNRCGQCKRMLP